MQLHRIDTVGRATAGSFAIAGATILCWTTVMGAAAANGAGHALLDAITAAAVITFGCVGAAGALHGKISSKRPSQQHIETGDAPDSPIAEQAASHTPSTIAQADAKCASSESDAAYNPAKRACMTLAQTHDLSLRERDVLDLMAQGMTGKEIAGELMLSYNTVKSHVRHIYVKLDVHRKQDLIDLIDQQRLVLEQQQRP